MTARPPRWRRLVYGRFADHPDAFLLAWRGLARYLLVLHVVMVALGITQVEAATALDQSVLGWFNVIFNGFMSGWTVRFLVDPDPVAEWRRQEAVLADLLAQVEAVQAESQALMARLTHPTPPPAHPHELH